MSADTSNDVWTYGGMSLAALGGGLSACAVLYVTESGNLTVSLTVALVGAIVPLAFLALGRLR